jgi:CRP-like cAMP-binding protein
MVSPEATKEFLESGWLTEMGREAREALLQVLEEHRATAQTTLLAQGRANDRVGFLLEGSLQVSRQNVRNETEVLCILSAPTMFGLTSFFRPSPPDFSLRALTAVRYLTLDHTAHDRLRKESPRVAEQLAVAAVLILADRLDALDRRITDDLAGHPDDHPKVTEWSAFRARLFEDATL